LKLAEEAKTYAIIHGSADAILAAAKAELEARKQLQDAKNSQDKADNANIDNTALPDLIKVALKDGADGLKEAFDGFKNSVETLADVLTQGINAVKSISSAVKGGIASGGTLGGIGAGLSKAAEYDPEPISKAILQIGGGILSLFGGMFKKHAQEIADRIAKETKTTLGTVSASEHQPDYCHRATPSRTSKGHRPTVGSEGR